MAKNLDLTEKNAEELVELLKEKRERLREVRFSATGARLADSNEPRKIRADIARIMTELTKRSRAETTA